MEAHVEAAPMTEAEWLKKTNPTDLLAHLRLRKRPAVSARKFRLLACACLRHVDHLLPDDGLRASIAAVERCYDDGEAGENMQDARSAILELQLRFHQPADAGENSWLWKTNSSSRIRTLLGRVEATSQPAFLVAVAARALTTMARSRSDQRLSGQIARWVTEYCAQAAGWAGKTPTEPASELSVLRVLEDHLVAEAESKHQLFLIREVFGNPFKPVTIEQAWRSWNDGTVVKLAQALYEEREIPSGYLDVGRLAILADALEEAGCANDNILSHCRGPGPHVRGCWVVDLLLRKE